jgi:hypothetical protein
MPKATWGAGDNALTAADLDNAERPESTSRYSGELPPAGTYRFTIQSLKKAESAAGNPKIQGVFLLDGSWRRNHKQYDTAPVFNHLALTDKNAPQVAQFLDAIGATGKDLLAGTIVDENGYITKLGRVGDPAGIQLYLNVQHSKTSEKYPNPRLEIAYGGYLPITDDDAPEPDAEPGADDAGTDDEPPF